MAGKIFINYRRGDDPGFSQLLYSRLEDEFKVDNLFMDVEGHIRPGDDFVEVLSAQVAASDILLAVIGPRCSRHAPVIPMISSPSKSRRRSTWASA